MQSHSTAVHAFPFSTILSIRRAYWHCKSFSLRINFHVSNMLQTYFWFSALQKSSQIILFCDVFVSTFHLRTSNSTLDMKRVYSSTYLISFWQLLIAITVLCCFSNELFVFTVIAVISRRAIIVLTTRFPWFVDNLNFVHFVAWFILAVFLPIICTTSLSNQLSLLLSSRSDPARLCSSPPSSSVTM